MSKIVVTGGNSGIGSAMVKALASDGHEIHIIDKAYDMEEHDVNCEVHICDVRSEENLRSLSREIEHFDVLINNAGVNFIDWLENVSSADWDRVMDTNAKGIFNCCKVFLPYLRIRKGTILNIISNASHMPMTNSIAYNASKGAAHIMTLQLARELGPKGITVFGISPNKIKGTGMSEYIESRVCDIRGWTPEFAEEYQLKALPAGEETDPVVFADFVRYILKHKIRHKFMAGTIIPYGK